MNRDPNDPTPLDPTTGVREISSDEFSKRVAAQVNGGANGVHHPSEPDPGFFATHEEADEAKSTNQEPIRPHDMDAEGAVMSALLLDPDALPK